jgi:PKD repeat protein
MAASYCGVNLVLDSAEHEEFVARFHDYALSLLTDTAWYSDANLVGLALPADPVDSPPQIGVLRWPTGASRCGTFYCFVNGTRLAAVRAALVGDYGDLVLSDGNTGHTVTARMRFLPALPVHQCKATDTDPANCWLLRLVDIRYGWRQQAGAISTTPASWSALFSALSSGLGTGVSVDTLVGGYTGCTPSPRWVTYEKQLPGLLDAAAYSVGQRVVVGLTGTAATVTPATAAASAAAQVAVDGFRKGVGGTLAASDFQLSAPASVVVAFGVANGGLPSPVPHLETRTLAGLAVAGYDGASGVAGEEKVLYADPVYDGVNAVTAFADQFAADYYLWRLAGVYDFTLPGIVNWTPTGCEDAVEWHYRHGGRLLTRVVSPPVQEVRRGDYLLPPVPDPVVRITAVTGGVGSYTQTYSVRAVTLTGGTIADESPVRSWTGVLEAKDRLLGVNNTNDPDLGVYRLTTAPDGTMYIDGDPTAGCGLQEDLTTGEFYVDADYLAGTGLTTEVVSGHCKRLAVNVAALPPDVTAFGCGLVEDAGTLSVDLTAVVVPPLTWSACSLDLAVGCGLDVIGGQLVVDPVDLAGSRAESALVPGPFFGSACDIGVDLEVDSTDTFPVEYDSCIEMYGGKLRLTKRKYTVTKYYNAAGLLIDLVADGDTTSYCEVDTCLFATCCSSTAPAATASASPSSGSSPLTVNFTGGASGGVSPYTYVWDFGDGNTSASQNPTHTYTAAADTTFHAVLTVTDACGRSTAATTVNVAVTGGCDAMGATNLYASTTSAGGANGCLGSDLLNDTLSAVSANVKSVTHGTGLEPDSSCVDGSCGYSVRVTCVGDGTFTVDSVPGYSGPPLTAGLTSSGGGLGSGTFHLSFTYHDTDSYCPGNPKDITVDIRDFTV